MGVAPENFLGATHIRALEEEVSKKVDLYVRLLQHSAEECEGEGVDIEVKITAGTPVRKVVIQEAASFNATWVILDRHLRREIRFYLKHIPCKVALLHDNLSLEILRPHSFNNEIEYIEDKQLFYSLSKPVPLLPVHDNEISDEQSVISISYYNGSTTSMDTEEFGTNPKQEKSTGDIKYYFSPRVISKQQRRPSWQKYLDVPVLCITCGLKTVLDSTRYSYLDLQRATNDFSSDNLLGEGEYGPVYKGRFKDGQLIAAKVRRGASTKDFAELHSEVYVLSFARHKNLVMLLGYCCQEDVNILVYEYICNKSLEWHLFDNIDVLDWHQRYTIAIGTAKGLRFLHEECRGSPIIHRDVRPGNILLTHDFVPMLENFGLAKWKTNEDDLQTRVLGSLGYLSPEYAENGIVSVRTDVYAFGIILIQLISGRKVDSMRQGKQLSLKEWALPLIETLSLHELADPRLGASCNTYEVYHMARTAYFCVQPDPQMRPSMAQVLCLLEGENDHFHHLTEQFIPHSSNN